MTITESAIRDRAYFIWEAEGRPHGQDQRHWAQAEREWFAAMPFVWRPTGETLAQFEATANAVAATVKPKPTRKPASSRKKAAP